MLLGIRPVAYAPEWRLKWFMHALPNGAELRAMSERPFETEGTERKSRKNHARITCRGENFLWIPGAHPV